MISQDPVVPQILIPKKVYNLLLFLLHNPSVEMQEAGSLASDYELSQVGAEKVWKAMASMLMLRVDQSNE